MKQIYYLHEREWNKFTEEPRVERLELYSSKLRNCGYFDLLLLEKIATQPYQQQQRRCSFGVYLDHNLKVIGTCGKSVPFWKVLQEMKGIVQGIVTICNRL